MGHEMAAWLFVAGERNAYQASVQLLVSDYSQVK